jgi:hypothetical protein
MSLCQMMLNVADDQLYDETGRAMSREQPAAFVM